MNQFLLTDVDGHTELLLGNEAIVRGAIEAGVAFACGYPGTASSEITDTFSRLAAELSIEFEYSVNEKIALEMAFAASLSGARSLVAMKHLGLAYAGDPLGTIPMVGTTGGMVIVSTGDPSCHTSPNEQDQRYLGAMLHIPVLEPSTPQEALGMTRFAFELSEKCHLPVLLRPTTRLCHLRAPVRFGPRQVAKVSGFVRDPQRLVPIPHNARRLRLEIPGRLAVARECMAEAGLMHRSGCGARAILASGVPAATVADYLEHAGIEDQVTLLTLGVVHPLPDDWLVASLQEIDTLVVVEELAPFLEDAVRALCSLQGLGTRVLGKRTGHFPTEFEYAPSVIRRGLHAALGLGDPVPATTSPPADAEIPVRAPILCASCGHRSAFFAARTAFGPDVLFFNDIGCYTLGYGAPLEAADALLSMGAGFTLAHGVSRTTGQRTVGFMGDSTFFHSGMPALLNAVKENANMVGVILDNQVTAMTGFQESPTVSVDAGQLERHVNIEGVVRALGVQHVQTVDPNDLAQTVAAFETAKAHTGMSVVITQRPCALFAERLAASGTASKKPAPSYAVDLDQCQHCGRQDTGHRCDQPTTLGFARAMARARSLEVTPASSPRPAVAPCATHCPLFLCVQGYAAHIVAGEYAEAFDLIMSGLPLPESVCRVCDRPCENACVRSGIDEPVAINDLKRFVVDWESRQPQAYRPACEADHGHRVAIVGAGPAGLAAAHELRIRGYSVTLFDREQEPGGVLRYGIPRYRLPIEALARDIARITDIGVTFQGGRELGNDLELSALAAEYDAVFLALGAGRPIELDVPAPDGMLVDGASFLQRAREDESATCGARVLVVGGGNSAVDAARCALRLGAESVSLVSLENCGEMRAIFAEVEEAREEGVKLVERHRVIAVRPGEVDLVEVGPQSVRDSNPLLFAAKPGTEQTVPCDQVIVAIGQTPFPSVGDEGEKPLARMDNHTVCVDPTTGLTSNDNVFAGGDLVAQPRSVTFAIASGLRAAWGIDCKVRGQELADRRKPPPLVVDAPAVSAPPHAEPQLRVVPPKISRATRTAGFDEVVAVFDEDQAQKEAKRCMMCGQCGNCRACVDLFGCPAFAREQDHITIDPALCTGCHVCAEFCPNSAIAPIALEVTE